MLDEVGKFILQELLGESFYGLFAGARSSKARRMKIAGWSCCFIAVVSFSAVAWRPDAIQPAVAVAIGAVAVAAALGFGFWASLINAYLAKREDCRSRSSPHGLTTEARRHEDDTNRDCSVSP